ncbi:MAG: hypothetical protein QOG84_114 [Sphingomonadales bacterium]|jgi:uncharacterized repeat protein (TIGR01451 family)|nr:hypothetical protein [Sphingomonadales bacterium]
MQYQFRRAGSPARARKAMLVAAGAAALGLAGAAQAAGTPAGTDITNVAHATYDQPSGTPATVDSNTVTIKVDELLDVTVAWRDPSDVVTSPGSTNQVLSFTVTNAGNGHEAFTLATVQGAGDDFDPGVTSIVLDTNGNGSYDPGVDTAYVAGSNDPQLAPDGSIVVFVLSTIPPAAADGNRGRIDLTATSKTGTGTPGTTFAGAGEGGGNAVVGLTTAKGQHEGWYAVHKASLSFVKSATVADPFGGATQGPGSIITYTLTATVTGTGSLANVAVTDPIPTGTTYKAGSITLDATPLTDAADADAGSFTGSGIAVGLGTMAAGATKTVKFQVKID